MPDDPHYDLEEFCESCDTEITGNSFDGCLSSGTEQPASSPLCSASRVSSP